MTGAVVTDTNHPSSPDNNSYRISEESLRAAVILLTHFVSDQFLDPHAGFVGQFAGAARAAENYPELQEILSRLLGTFDAMEFNESQIVGLNQQLAAEDLPGLVALRGLV